MAVKIPTRFIEVFKKQQRLTYLLVFLISILITSLFLILLPERWKVNESSDFLSFYEPLPAACWLEMVM